MKRAAFALILMTTACSSDPKRADEPWVARVQRVEGFAPRAIGTTQGDDLVAHGLSYRAALDGVTLTDGSGATASIRVLSFGRGATRESLPVAGASLAGSALAVEQGPVRTSYRGGPLGLEQSLIVGRPPRVEGAGPLAIEMNVAHDGDDVTSTSADRIEVRDPSGRLRFAVHDLHAFDARGRALPCELLVREHRLVLSIDDRGATYPLDVDPIFDSVSTLTPAAAAGDTAGADVAIAGDVAFVGAPFDDAGATDAGSVHVFERGTSGWAFKTKLQAGDPTASARFGSSLAYDGGVLIVGAPGAGKGAAYVFRNGTSWTQAQKLEPSDGASGDGYGAAVAISGGTAVIGAPAHDKLATDAGAAYVMQSTSTGFAFAGKLLPSAFAPNDGFGSAVAIDGSTIVAGSPRLDGGATDTGGAFVFSSSSGTWTEIAKLSFGGLSAGDQAGRSVAVRGSTALVGAPLQNAAAAQGGAVYVFGYDLSGWTQKQRFRPTDYDVGKQFGTSLALVDGLALIGTPFDTVAGATTGSAYLFVNGAKGFTQLAKLVPPVSTASRFGTSVALGIDVSIVGTPGTQQAFVFRNTRPSALGAACTTSLECASGHCADGVCCDTDCTGTCQACTATKKGSGTNGTCGPAATGSDPHEDCAIEPESSCGQTGVCDGAGACALYAEGTRCGPTQCVTAVYTSFHCDGKGTCASTKASCAPFACDPLVAACRSSCTLDAECMDGAMCVAGVCTWKKENGEASTSARECRSGFAKDGYCCSAACDGPCEACDLPGAAGICLPVSGGAGARHGSCPIDDPANPCSARICDGKTGASCAALVGSTVVCSAPSCTDGTESAAARCDGEGKCATPKTHACDGYACEGASCRVACTAPEHCASGFTCDVASGRCERAPTCDDTGRVLIEASGTRRDCAPYTCLDGACLRDCLSTDECALGFTCDLATSTCVEQAPATAADSGGCTVGAPGRRGGSFLTLALLAFHAVRRRRSSR